MKQALSKPDSQIERPIPSGTADRESREPAAASITQRLPAFASRVEESVKRAAGEGISRNGGLLLLLRVSCFLSIAIGILSLLSIWTGLASGAARIILVTPDEALGLIFLGFAVRMSRLEAHRRTIRIIVKTSRAGLILLGVSAVTGLRVLDLVPSAGSVRLGGGTGFAIGACYLLTGASLLFRNGFARNRMHAALTWLACAYLGSCWISLLLAGAGMAAIPIFLRIEVVPLLLMTAIGYVLFSALRTPEILKVLSQRGPEAEAARLMLPLAFAIPLALAILRHEAESKGWLPPDLGLVLHVLLSVGSMGLMIVWNANRIHSAKQLRERTDVAVEELETQYRDIFAVLQDPVWIFSAEGQLHFRNDAAREYGPPEGRNANGSGGAESALGIGQQRAILSAALLGGQMAEMKLRERVSGALRTLEIKFLRSLNTQRGERGAIILVARAARSEA